MQVAIDTTHLPHLNAARVVMLQSKWYSEHVDRMVAACRTVLEQQSISHIEHYVVSGSLELPITSQWIAQRSPKPDAIICFGAIMKGETMHFEMIVDECIRGLGSVMLKYDVPILVEVLPILNLEQLIARSGDNKLNKGIEAAVAAIETIALRRQLLPQAA